MLGDILELLRIARENNLKGEFIDVALGKNKMPETLKEAYQRFKNKN